MSKRPRFGFVCRKGLRRASREHLEHRLLHHSCLLVDANLKLHHVPACWRAHQARTNVLVLAGDRMSSGASDTARAARRQRGSLCGNDARHNHPARYYCAHLFVERADIARALIVVNHDIMIIASDSRRELAGSSAQCRACTGQARKHRRRLLRTTTCLIGHGSPFGDIVGGHMH